MTRLRNWLLRRPTVASVIIGARNEAQLRQNLGWSDDPVTRYADMLSADEADSLFSKA